MSDNYAIDFTSELESDSLWLEQITLKYEGQELVHIVDFPKEVDALEYVEDLLSKLERYRNRLNYHHKLKRLKKLNLVSIKLTHIYLMFNHHDSLYKIGRSINPEFRERTLQSQVPHIQNVFTSCLTYQANETKLHKYFSHKRLRGEWFNLNETDVLFIKNFDYSIKK